MPPAGLESENHMRTVNQIAKELGVSPQAIYKKVNGSLKGDLKKNIHKDKITGKTLIDDKGFEIIKARSIQTNKAPAGSNQEPDQIPNSFVTLLGDQLKEKDRQIAELMNQNKSLIDKLENMQVLLKNEQQQQALLVDNSNKKTGLFDRLFKTKPEE